MEARSLYRLKKWANLIDSKQDVSDDVYKKFIGLFHINSVKLLDFWIDYIKENDRSVNTDTERLMRNMLYYTFFKNIRSRWAFTI